MKTALITGCTGQDGSYLTEFLLGKGYEVHGLKRRASSFNTDRVDHIYLDLHETGNRFFLHYGDLTDGSSLSSLLHDLEPDEIYNLGAQSHVKVSFEIPEFTADVVACGTLRLLEAMRLTGVKCRFRGFLGMRDPVFDLVWGHRDSPANRLQDETAPRGKQRTRGRG